MTPRLAQPLDDAEQPGDLRLGQRAGRLVHDQDFGLERQRLGDFDQLLIADAQRADRLPGSMWHSSCASSSPAAVHGPVVEQAAAAAQLAAEKDIGGRRELLDQVQLLMDDADAGLLGVARAAKPHRPAAEQKVPSKSGMTPERIFINVLLPAPFSPTDRMQFARQDVERNVGQRRHAGIALGDLADRDEGFGGHGWTLHRACGGRCPRNAAVPKS